MISKLCPAERMHAKVLDAGCGKGEVGKYLKDVGFHHTMGLDCRRSLLQIANSKKCYDKLDHYIFGQGSTPEAL
jgi:predicted TPR repeat methyltransferase